VSVVPVSKPKTPPPATGLPQVILKAHEDRRVRRGHSWVFSNEVESFPEAIEPGALVHFLTGRHEFLGVGFYNPSSLISGRLLDRRPMDIDLAFFQNRLRRAKELRDGLFPDGAYRWVFGESDDLPGLVIDRFGDACVLESYCAGMDRLIPKIAEAVASFGPWKAIVLKNDAATRKLERLPEEVKVLQGAVDKPHWFKTDGLDMAADLLEGQKTGFFFDQRANRAAVAALSPGKTVLDVFCHTGGFGLWCAKAGATRVTGIDESTPALELATSIAERNGFAQRLTFQKAEALDFLARTKETFGLVVLDPPRFASSKKNLPEALRAYVRMNALGLRRVTGGGFLATSSCSQHVDREEFRQILSRAIHESGRHAVVVHTGGAGPDHPVRPAMPETEYLKFAILHVAS